VSVLTAEGRIPDHHMVSRVAVILVLATVALSLAIPSGAAPASSEPPWSPASPVVVRDATAIAASVYNQVGVTSTAEPVTPPVAVSGQPTLRFTTPGGKELPGVFIYCAGYAPFCASERWAVVAALSRFGTFRDLGNMDSSSVDLYPNTPTLTFLRATFSSRYLAFKSDEYFGNEVSKSGTSYVVLQPLTAEERRLVDTYTTRCTSPHCSPEENMGFPSSTSGTSSCRLRITLRPFLPD
jgi:hypothetical protein